MAPEVSTAILVQLPVMDFSNPHNPHLLLVRHLLQPGVGQAEVRAVAVITSTVIYTVRCTPSAYQSD